MDAIGRLCLLGDDPWILSVLVWSIACPERTLNVRDALVKDLLEGLGVLKLLLDLGNNGLGKLALLPLLDLALVADPGVEDRLGLVGNGGLLLELESLGLKLGSLLLDCQSSATDATSVSPCKPYLGNLEKGLGDVNDTAKVLDALDALLDSGGVVLAGSVQDAGDLVGLLLRIVSPRGTSIFGDSPENSQQRESDNRLLVDDVELVADSGDTETSTGREHSSLGEGAVSGHGYRVKERLSLLLGVLLRQVGLVAGGDGDGRQSAERERWAETGGACCV
jgi:hypothetical protein